MRNAIVAVLIVLGLASPALGALTRAQLNSVSISPPPGAHIDLKLTSEDTSGKLRSLGEILSGRTALVNFADLTCNTLCDTDLQLLSQAIQKSRLDPHQYRIVVIGIDPNDGPNDARSMEQKEIPRPLWRNTTFLLPDARFIRNMTTALGFHYVYDRALDQFAHPAAVYVIGPDGVLRATLSPFALSTTDLRSVLQSPASEQTFFRKVRLLCYAYDPATGIYTLRITFILKIAAAVTVLAVAASVFAFMRMGRRAV